MPGNQRLLLILTGIGLSVLFFVAAFKLYPQSLYSIDYPLVKGLTYENTSISDQFNQVLHFALVMALIPALIILLWLMGPITSGWKRLLSVLVVFTLIGIAIKGRQLWFGHMLLEMKNNLYGVDAPFHLTIADNVQSATYILFGLAAGIVLSWLLLRERKSSVN